MELILNDDQLQQFDTEGWLFFENVFGAEEIALLNGEAHRIFAMDRAEVFRESDGKTARTALRERRATCAAGSHVLRARALSPLR